MKKMKKRKNENIGKAENHSLDFSRFFFLFLHHRFSLRSARARSTSAFVGTCQADLNSFCSTQPR